MTSDDKIAIAGTCGGGRVLVLGDGTGCPGGIEYRTDGDEENAQRK